MRDEAVSGGKRWVCSVTKVTFTEDHLHALGSLGWAGTRDMLLLLDPHLQVTSDFYCSANPYSIQLYDGTVCDLISSGKNGKAASGAISHKYIDINILQVKNSAKFSK